ncbi:hypothetical protein M3Y94_01097600 [Aphelenchoides besseyi]|nr:hypothetical protein M3Y94_01097600 [Aphelenchoides besseyi]
MAFLRGSMRTPRTVTEILTALGIVLLVVLIALSVALYCFWFRRDKRKKKAAREVIKENARIGERVTDEQARALYELNDSWEKFWKCAEQEKRFETSEQKIGSMCELLSFTHLGKKDYETPMQRTTTNFYIRQ